MTSGSAKFIFPMCMFNFLMGAIAHNAVLDWRWFAADMMIYAVISGIVIWCDEINARKQKRSYRNWSG